VQLIYRHLDLSCQTYEDIKASLKVIKQRPQLFILLDQPVLDETDQLQYIWNLFSHCGGHFCLFYYTDDSEGWEREKNEVQQMSQGWNNTWDLYVIWQAL